MDFHLFFVVVREIAMMCPVIKMHFLPKANLNFQPAVEDSVEVINISLEHDEVMLSLLDIGRSVCS